MRNRPLLHGFEILIAGIVTAGGWISPSPASAQVGSLIVTITSPASGTTVGGTIPVNASVSILGGLTVRGVQFKLDGANLGAEDTTAPYSVGWNTTTASNAPHTLRAVARDALGLLWTSGPVTVTVFNDKTPPVVAIASPAAGAIVGGSVSFGAGASDDVGVTQVEFLAAGAVIGQDTTAPYSVTWDTRTVGNGPCTLTARARDAAGNTSTSAPVTVTVSNDVARIEETSTAVVYAGAWEHGNTGHAWSEVTAAVSAEALARATLSFTGTGVTWIGYRGPDAGIARVVLDGIQVATVDAFAATGQGQAVLFMASALTEAEHTLVIEVAGAHNSQATGSSVVVDAFDVQLTGTGLTQPYAPGDLLISLETGPVQWRGPDGTLKRVLGGIVSGTGEGMTFDAAGNLYVTRWCNDPTCTATGNTVEKFDVHGRPLGAWGSGYNCSPHTMVFDAAGAAYVGQAGCARTLLKLVDGQPAAEFAVAPDTQGVFWVALAPDGCTMHYTSWGPNVKRFDVCTGEQRPDLNAAPLPGGEAQDLRILPDGTVLVSSTAVIVRLDASGSIVQTYSVPGESRLWIGLDLVGDGTFWVANYESSNVYRFDLATGAVLSSFHAGTPTHTVVGLNVKK
jgi:hypothetical protein